MQFPYFKIPKAPCLIDKKSFCYRPMLNIEITPNGKKYIAIDALVDTGADYNMAPLELANAFGLDLSVYPHLDFFGIDQKTAVKCFFVPFTIVIEEKEIYTHIAFGGQVPNILLGQKGFLDKIKEISFRYSKYFEIKF